MDGVIEFLATAVGYIGIAFIVGGVMIALVQYAMSLVGTTYTMNHVRLTLGVYIILGLEFMVGQDIIETVLHTDLHHLKELGAIVLIRTTLEYFLNKEIEHLRHLIHEEEHGGHGHGPAGHGGHGDHGHGNAHEGGH